SDPNTHLAWFVDATGNVDLTDSFFFTFQPNTQFDDNAGLSSNHVIGQTKQFDDTVGSTDPLSLAISLVFSNDVVFNMPADDFGFTIPVVATDLESVTDSISFGYARQMDDPTNVVESIALFINKQFDDPAGMLDDATPNLTVVPTAYTLSFLDDGNTSDSFALSQTKVLGDNSGLTDLASIGTSKLFTDAEGMTDAVNFDYSVFFTD